MPGDRYPPGRSRSAVRWRRGSMTLLVLAQFLEPKRMDARVLIGIFDLGAAFLDADIGALVFRADATLPNDWIALGAEAHGEIAGRLCAGRKVLMKHAVRGRKAQSGTPIDLLQI